MKTSLKRSKERAKTALSAQLPVLLWLTALGELEVTVASGRLEIPGGPSLARCHSVSGPPFLKWQWQVSCLLCTGGTSSWSSASFQCQCGCQHFELALL